MDLKICINTQDETRFEFDTDSWHVPDPDRFREINGSRDRLRLLEYELRSEEHPEYFGFVLLNPNTEELDPDGLAMKRMLTLAQFSGADRVRFGFLFTRRSETAADLEDLSFTPAQDRKLRKDFLLPLFKDETVEERERFEEVYGLESIETVFAWGRPFAEDDARSEKVRERGGMMREVLHGSQLCFCIGKHEGGEPWNFLRHGSRNWIVRVDEDGKPLSRPEEDDLIQDMLAIAASWLISKGSLDYVSERTNYETYYYGRPC